MLTRSEVLELGTLSVYEEEGPREIANLTISCPLVQLNTARDFNETNKDGITRD